MISDHVVEAPKIYDGGLDELRPITEKDIHDLQDTAWCLAHMREIHQGIVEVFTSNSHAPATRRHRLKQISEFIRFGEVRS